VFTTFQRAAARTLIAAAAVITLAGCAATTSGHGSAPATSSSGAGAPATSEAPTSEPPTSTEPSASGTLSKADFVSRMNVVCAGVSRTLTTSAPTSVTDYPALRNFAAATLTLFQAYITQAKTLAAKTADSADLNDKWISVEESDFNRGKPLLVELIAAADAKDAAKVDALESQLGALPDHSAAIASFMTAYGLTDCAQLETG
jgi:hypothetical protein